MSTPKRSLLRGRPAGFSLVELLVVIAILSLLMGILLPSLRKARSSALQLRCTHNLQQLSLAMSLYMANSDDIYPCANDPVSTDPCSPYWLWMGRGWRSLLKPHIQTTLNANNPSVLLCPADKTDPNKYERTSYAYSMAFYHSREQIDGMDSVENTYRNPLPSIRQKRAYVTFPSSKIMLGEWFSHHVPIEKDTGWWTWEGTRNFLFVDGQIRLLKATGITPARDGLPDANLTVHGIKGKDL